LFKTLDEVKENVFEGWELFDGTITTMFEIKKDYALA
jgi:hypothetical protein